MRRKSHLPQIILIMVFGFITVIISVLSVIIANYIVIPATVRPLLIPALIIVTFLLVTLSSLQYFIQSSPDTELAPIREERQNINKRLEEKPKDVTETIRLGLNQLTEYYVINKSQAKNSYTFSLFAIVLGLITIITGVGVFYLQSNQNLQLTAITGISGTLLEFIGGAYFFVYRKSIEQMNLYFNQLVKMQDTMLAVNLTKDIQNQEKQINLTEKVITALLERSSSLAVDLINPTEKTITKKKRQDTRIDMQEVELSDHH